MTTTTSAGPTTGEPGASGTGKPGPDAPGDPFDRDVLPTPPGATSTLLRSLLAPMKARVAFTTLLLLLQQAAVQAAPLLVAYAIDNAVPALRDHDRGPLVVVAVGYLLCALTSGGLQFTFIEASARVSQDVLLDLRGRIFRHAQALSVDFHERYTSGRLISRSTTDVESLRELLNEGLQELVTVVLSFLYISAMLLWLDLGIGAVAVASFVPLFLLVRLYRRRAGRVFRARSTAIAAVIVKFVETMNGIRPVRAFRREAVNDAEFAVLNERHARTNGDGMLEMARYVVGSRLVANTAVAAMVLWGAYRVASGSLALGVLAAAVLYLRRLYDPIDRLGMFLNSYQSAAASLEKIAGLLAQTPSVPEPAEPRELPPLESDLPGREVVFDQVRFAYRTGGEVLPASTSPCPPERRSRWSAPRARASRRWPSCSPASTTPPRGACCWTVSTCASCRSPNCAAGWSWSRRRRSCSPARSRTTSRSAARRPPARRSSRRRRPSARTSSSADCPTATTRTYASAAAASPPDSANWSRSPARCSPTPPY